MSPRGEMPALVFHHALLGLAVLTAVTSAAVFSALAWRQHSAPQRTVVLELAGFTAGPPAGAASLKPVTWPRPGPQARGREWIYDTFTPPEIYYHPRSRQFTVHPPSTLEVRGAEPFGLELVAVQPDPFRVQLIGYSGEAGNWRGTFEHTVSGEVFVAGAGRRIPQLGLTIQKVSVSTEPAALAQGMPTSRRVATAIVRDERDGRDMVLVSGSRSHAATATAIVAGTGDVVVRELRPGESWPVGTATYRIERVHISPPAVEVTKEVANGTPERRTLSPRDDGGLRAAGPSEEGER